MGVPLIAKQSGWAGLYGPNAVITINGQAVANQGVTVESLDATGAIVGSFVQYADFQRTTWTGPALTTDNEGNLTFWTDPGYYQINVPGFSVAPFNVVVSPFYSDATWNAPTTDSSGSTITTLSGDSRAADANAASITETLPTPTAGARFRVTKTDSNPLTWVDIQAADGSLIFGPDGGSGYTSTTSMRLYGQGNSYEFMADNGSPSHWRLVGTNPRRVGVVDMWAGNSGGGIPAGALLCNGAGYPTASYPDLFAVIGTQYGGSGDTFNVPNFGDRVPVGPGSYSVGQPFGGWDYTIVSSDLPSHSHTIGNNGGVNNFFVQPPTGTEAAFINNANEGQPGTLLVSYGNVTDAAYGPQTTNIPLVQPSLGINFIIWTQ